MGYIGVKTHLLTIDPNFQRDIQVVVVFQSWRCDHLSTHHDILKNTFSTWRFVGGSFEMNQTNTWFWSNHTSSYDLGPQNVAEEGKSPAISGQSAVGEILWFGQRFTQEETVHHQKTLTGITPGCVFNIVPNLRGRDVSPDLLLILWSSWLQPEWWFTPTLNIQEALP